MPEHPELRGYHPTIASQKLSNDVLDTGTMDQLKEDFEEDYVDSDTLFEVLLYRKEFDRQKLLDHFDIVNHLAEKESDPENMMDIMRCLGDFPKYEKEFLAHFLSYNESSEDKFKFLEEVIFSKTQEFLEQFVEAETRLNTTIIENLSSRPINGNENITNAVRAIFNMQEDANFNPFPLSPEMYEISDGGRSLKTTYNFCRDKPLRQVFLKNLLLEANRQNKIPLVTKIILSHCYIDLKSILDAVTVSEDEEATLSELKFDNPPDLSNIKELSCLNDIEGDLLRELVQTAAFGRSGDC